MLNLKLVEMKVLYTRVSSLSQSAESQRLNPKEFDWIITDTVSGAVDFFSREGGKELKKLCLEGKVASIHMWSIDRCGRNLLGIIQSLEFFSEHKIPVYFTSQGLRTLDEDGKENPIAKMVIGILGVIAEMSRVQILENQRRGIELAKAQGVYLGRKKGTKESVQKFLSKPKNMKTLKLLEQGYKGTEISKILVISPNTVMKVRKLGLPNKNK